MKKIFCLAFVLLSAISIFAQERVIGQAEFDAALKYRFLKFARQSYRQTETSVDVPTETNKSKYTSKAVMEYAQPLASRLLYEFDSPTVKMRQETIRINGKTYTRKDNGEWRLSSDSENPNKPVADRKFVTVEEQTEYKALGSEVLNNLKASVYAKIEKKKLVHEADKREMFSTISTKYWLDEDGGIMKEEILTENLLKSERNPAGMTFRNLRTRIWEFDPNIKIEAPIPAK
jgi:hypothetical protein